jgi:hypothetical protein
MKRLGILVTCWTALWLSAAPRKDASQTPAALNDIIASLGEITGWKPLKKIRYDTLDRDQLKRYLDKRMREVVKPEQIRVEELTLKKFGFIPQDYDLRASTIELLTEQAAAFYDFRKDRLYLVGSSTAFSEDSLLAHELAHALADQHINLDRYVREGEENDDGALARMAVMEGQASWLMSEYAARRTGKTLADQPAVVAMLSDSNQPPAAEYPVLRAAPLYIRETLMFPYTRGLLFQHRVYERMGKAGFAEVFRRPPASTREVLHPDVYFARVSVPDLKAAEISGYRAVTAGSLGELDHSILLRQYIGEAEADEISPGWRGGAYALLEHKRSDRFALSYISQWDSADDARRFFGLYQRVLRGKWRSIEIERQDESRVRGRGDDGIFELRLEGSRVISLEGLAIEDVAKLRSAGSLR